MVFLENGAHFDIVNQMLLFQISRYFNSTKHRNENGTNVKKHTKPL